MPPELSAVFAAQGGVATSAQILFHLSRRGMQRRLKCAELVKIFPGIYSLGAPEALTRLRGLDLRCGEHVAVCLGTAAALFGFDTEGVTELHVLNPEGHLLRDHTGLVVHRRDGAPLIIYRGRRLTTPGWTAVEVARSLRRPRALATLDAALRSQTCDRRDLEVAAKSQAGRRGIVAVRDLIPKARPEAESPMESEARLVMPTAGYQNPFCSTRSSIGTGDCGESILRGRIAGSPLNTTDSIGTVHQRRCAGTARKEPLLRRSTGGSCPSSATMSDGTAT
jgi:hypothetical protein